MGGDWIKLQNSYVPDQVDRGSAIITINVLSI